MRLRDNPMDIERLEDDLKKDVESCENLEDLESVRVKYLGRKGAVTAILRGIKDASPEERPRLGSESNRLKKLCESLIAEKKTRLGGDEAGSFYEPPVDGTLPATDGLTGRRHVLNQTFRQMKTILHGMGYSPAKGPDVELEYYNFQALNFPNDEHDTDGFAALRRALRDRTARRLVQASQDVLTLLSQDGIYMDDLRPDPVSAEMWRRFAGGERGKGMDRLGAIRDRSSLALAAGRMREDAIFRDAVHHFLRRFDEMLVTFEEHATDTDLLQLAETRTSRAFMLLARATGTFD